jgi:diguanylate cyclase (GGDEF)-like protein
MRILSGRRHEFRRAADHGLMPPLMRLDKSVAHELDAAVTGRLLLAAAGVATTVAAPLLQPDARGWLVLVATGASMIVLLALSAIVPWSRLPARATMAFPVAVCVALVAMGTGAPGLIAPLTGLLTLCFAYLGLTQAPGTSVLALPVAATTFILTNGGLTRATTVRLLLACFVWVLLAELLARLTTRQRALSVALLSAAHTDALTGLANRRDLDIHMSLAVAGDLIVLCDLDNFKALNDSLGHYAGDRVLAEFGSMLRAGLRAQDYCARYGGEEFFLLLPRTTLPEAEAVLSRLHATWSTLQPTETFSAGIAVCRVDRAHTVTLTKADQALYAAKDAGRNTDRTEPVRAREATASARASAA